MEIRIAICDDEPAVCEQLGSMTTVIMKELSVSCAIDSFASGEELCREVESTDYDLIFLDIELPDMDGIEIGSYIRETLNNETVQIAYISGHQHYAMKLFDYRPINFLVKPLEYDKVKKVLSKYMVLIGQNDYMFSYKKGAKIYHISLADIMYFSSRGRKITIATKDWTDEFYGLMSEIDAQIVSHRFLYIHKSFLVNYNYVASSSYEEITMLDGTVFPISQARRKAIRRRFLQIWEEDHP